MDRGVVIETLKIINFGENHLKRGVFSLSSKR